MYKVFINDKPLIFTSSIENAESYPLYQLKNVVFEEVIHKLRHTNLQGIYIYSPYDRAGIDNFLGKFKVVTAGGGLVKNNKKELLFIFRGNRWDLPKGHTEKGESIEETSIREVEEECGITNLKIKKFLLTTYHVYFLRKKPQIKETHWFLMGSDFEGELKPQLEEGITKVCFLAESKIPEMFKNTYANIKLVYQSYKSVK